MEKGKDTVIEAVGKIETLYNECKQEPCKSDIEIDCNFIGPHCRGEQVGEIIRIALSERVTKIRKELAFDFAGKQLLAKLIDDKVKLQSRLDVKNVELKEKNAEITELKKLCDMWIRLHDERTIECDKAKELYFMYAAKYDKKKGGSNER